MRQFTRLTNAFSKKLDTSKGRWSSTSRGIISSGFAKPSGDPGDGGGGDRSMWELEELLA